MLVHRLTRWPAALAVGGTIVALTVGIVLVVNQTSAGSPLAAKTPAALPTCGSLPVSNGAHAESVRATLKVPTTGQSGQRIIGQIELSSISGDAVKLQTGQPSDLLIIYGGKVVGRYNGATLATGAFVTVGPQVKVIPTGVLLKGCASKSDPAHPDIGRRPLPPGQYQLVATLVDLAVGYSAEAVLATQPVNITVSS